MENIAPTHIPVGGKTIHHGDIMIQTRKATQFPIILLLALMLAACASLGDRDEKKRTESLKTAVEVFNGSFKWEDYAAAAELVPPDKKKEFWAEVDRFKGKIHIVEYQLREIQESAKSSSATVLMNFQYWRTDAPKLLTAPVAQKWHFMEKEKKWMIQESGFATMPTPRGV